MVVLFPIRRNRVTVKMLVPQVAWLAFSHRRQSFRCLPTNDHPDEQHVPRWEHVSSPDDSSDGAALVQSSTHRLTIGDFGEDGICVQKGLRTVLDYTRQVSVCVASCGTRYRRMTLLSCEFSSRAQRHSERRATLVRVLYSLASPSWRLMVTEEMIALG